MKIICFIKTLWYTIRSKWLYDGVYISGCDFIEQSDGTLICEICGKETYGTNR